MFISHHRHQAASSPPRRWLWTGLLALTISLFSTVSWPWGTVAFEDHFDDVASLQNWSVSGIARIDEQMLLLDACTSHYACEAGPGWFADSYALINRDPERNFDFSVTLLPNYANTATGRIIVHATGYYGSWDGDPAQSSGKVYELDFGSTTDPWSGLPVQYDRLTLTRADNPPNTWPVNGNPTVAEATYGPLDAPIAARVVVNGGTIKAFVNGTQVLNYIDSSPLPPGQIGLGGGYGTNFDDVILKPLPDLRCSPDSKVDGLDRSCEGGLFDQRLWIYLGPDDKQIKQVVFYLDGELHRRESFAPWELDGGAVSQLGIGPHEVKAKVLYKNGRWTTMSGTFVVGEHPLRCSPDPILDGNDGPCEGGYFDAPTWVYWWPETGVASVDFSVNGLFHRTERYAPFELDGGASSVLMDYQSGYPTEIKASVRFKDGRQPLTLSAQASVIRSDLPIMLACSTDAILGGLSDGYDYPCGFPPEPQRAYLWPEQGIRYVDFYLDGVFHRTERYAPFEFDGGAWTRLPAGNHDITAIVHFTDESMPAAAMRFPVSGSE